MKKIGNKRGKNGKKFSQLNESAGDFYRKLDIAYLPTHINDDEHLNIFIFQWSQYRDQSVNNEIYMLVGSLKKNLENIARLSLSKQHKNHDLITFITSEVCLV
jgi:hypothetical protein